jgi:hypothetical protein
LASALTALRVELKQAEAYAADLALKIRDLEECTDWHLVADGIKHHPGCPNHFAGEADNHPCLRCVAESMTAKVAELGRKIDAKDVELATLRDRLADVLEADELRQSALEVQKTMLERQATEIARLTALAEERRKDALYHSDCRPNRLEAMRAIADAKATNERWADEVAARREADTEIARLTEECGRLSRLSDRCQSCDGDEHYQEMVRANKAEAAVAAARQKWQALREWHRYNITHWPEVIGSEEQAHANALVKMDALGLPADAPVREG